jgi:hypothetical protein
VRRQRLLIRLADLDAGTRTAEPIDGAIPNDRQQPRAQAAARWIEALDLLPRRHECIVHQVLRQLPIRHDAHGDRHRDRRIPVVQQAERLAIAGPESFRQELVVGCVR